MDLRLKRIFKCADYTIGCLYVDGQFFCNTLEDTDRGLKDSQNVLYIKARKIFGKTVGKYLTFRDNVKWADPKTYKDANLPRAKKIWAVAKTFGAKTAKESVIIDYIIEKGSWEADLPKIAALTEKQKDILENVNKNDRKDTFLDMIG